MTSLMVRDKHTGPKLVNRGSAYFGTPISLEAEPWPWTPPGSERFYQMALRRQRIEAFYRYRYVVTNLPPAWSAEEVIDATYERCDPPPRRLPC